MICMIKPIKFEYITKKEFITTQRGINMFFCFLCLDNTQEKLLDTNTSDSESNELLICSNCIKKMYELTKNDTK